MDKEVMHMITSSALIFILSTTPQPAPASELVIHPEPSGVAESSDYSVTVNSQSVFCYAHEYRYDHVWDYTVSPPDLTYYTEEAAFAIFDFSGPVSVEITMPAGYVDPDKLVIRPLSRNIDYTLSNNNTTLTFTLDEPGDILIEPRGEGRQNLCLFTNFPEKDIPDPNDPDVIYYGPGKHTVEDIVLTSGKTLYLAGGAVVELLPTEETANIDYYSINGMGPYYKRTPAIQASSATDVTIRGRGILSGRRGAEVNRRHEMLSFKNCENCVIRDVVFLSSTSFNLDIFQAEYFLVDNVRILSHYNNSDGILFDSCQNSVAQNCFLMQNDDGLEIKTRGSQISENILFTDCIVWSETGSPLGVTHEVKHTVSNCTWKNITVLNSFTTRGEEVPHRAAGIFVHSGEDFPGSIENILFENIVLENVIGNRPVILVDNAAADTFEEAEDQTGPHSPINGVTVRNMTCIHVDPEWAHLPFPGVFIYDETSSNIVQNIDLECVFINGTEVTSGSSYITSYASPGPAPTVILNDFGWPMNSASERTENGLTAPVVNGIFSSVNIDSNDYTRFTVNESVELSLDMDTYDVLKTRMRLDDVEGVIAWPMNDYSEIRTDPSKTAGVIHQEGAMSCLVTTNQAGLLLRRNGLHYNLGINAADYNYLRVRAWFDSTAAAGRNIRLLWQNTSWHSMELPAVGGWNTYLFDLGNNTNWSGTVNMLRFDGVFGAVDYAMALDYVHLLETENHDQFTFFGKKNGIYMQDTFQAHIGTWHDYEIDMNQYSWWNGGITTRLRFDFCGRLVISGNMSADIDYVWMCTE